MYLVYYNVVGAISLSDKVYKKNDFLSHDHSLFSESTTKILTIDVICKFRHTE